MPRPTSRAPRTPAAKGRRGAEPGLTDAVLDALPAAIAQLGPDGRIQLTNKHWRRPGPHGPLRGPAFKVGVDYLAACRRAPFPAEAGELAAGIARVMAGELPGFNIEYGGRPGDGTWFRVMVTPAEGGAVVAHVDVSDRRQREVDARLREDVLTHAQEIAHLGQWDMDLSTGLLRWSAETHRIFGLEPGTFEGTYEAFLARLHPEDQGWTDKDRRKALREGKVLERDYRLVRPDGSLRWVHEWGEAELGPDGRPLRLSGVVLDITERRRAELRLERLQRLYAMQSRINEAIVMARTPDELFRLSCSAAIREGGLRMAFIARLDPGTGILEPVAWEGHVEGYLEGLRITTDGSPHAQGPMGTALRTGQLAGSADIAVDPHMAPWREAALARGFRSAAAIPLVVDGQSVGALSLFSGEPGYFQEEERQLLVAVGENLSYALGAMAQRARQKASEAALRQSEDRFAAAFDHAAGGIALVGLDGRLLKVNRGFGALLGYEPEELERLRFQDITHPEDLARDLGAFQEVIQGRRASYQARKRYLKKDGSVVWVQISTALVRDADGGPLHCITQIQDLTEQELAIADLARLRRQSDLILASVADGIHGIDREGRILFENPAAVAMLGWSRDELLGQDAHGLFHDRRADGSRHEQADCPIHQTLQDGVVRQVEGDWFRRKDGSGFLVAYSTHPLRDERGAIAGVVVTFRDISRDLALRADLERNQALMRMAGGLARLGAWSVEIPGGQVHWSDEVARIHGVPPGYAPTVDEGLAFYAPEHRVQVREALERCARDGTPVDLEVQLVNRQGGRLWVHTLGEAVRDASGAIIRVQGAFQDITPDRSVRADLEQNQAQLRMAGRLARLGAWAVFPAEGRGLWSDEVAEIHGMPKGYSPTLAEALAFCAPEFRESVAQAVQACSDQGEPFDMELQVVRPCGQRVWVRALGEAVRDEAGAIIRIQGAFQDISSQKELEQALQQRTELLRISERVGRIGGWAADMFTQEVFWSDMVKEILDMPPTVEPPPLERALDLYPDEFRPFIRETLEACAQGRSFEVEAQINTARDRRIWVRIWGEPERDMHGNIRRIFGAFQDISGQKALEQELRDRTELLRISGQVARIGGWAVDLDTQMVFWSDMVLDILERPAGSATPALAQAMEIYPEGTRAFMADTLAACAAGQSFSVEVEVLTAKGNRRWARIWGEPERDAQGGIRRIYGAAQDVTDRKAIEAERARLQEDLFQTLETISDGFITLDRDWRFTYANGPAERIMRRTRQEVVGRSLWEIFPEAVGSVFDQAYREAAEQRKTVVVEARYDPLDLWVEEHIYPTDSGIAIYIRDISERNRLDALLQRKTTLLGIAEQVGRIGGWMIEVPSMDLYWSDMIFGLLEREPGDMPSLERGLDVYAPEYRQVVADLLQRSATEGVPFDIEAEFLTATGKRRWARVWGEAVRREDGAIHRLQGAAQDISDRKRIEAERQRLESDLVQTLESISDGFVTLDREWRVTYVNGPAERIMQRPRQELLGRSIWELFPGAEGSAFEEAYRAAAETRQTRVFEAPFEPLGLWVEEHVYPTEAGLAIYIRDITERRKGESALRESEERFRLLAKATRDAIWDWNLETGELWWNEGYFELFGYRPGEVAPDLGSWDQRIHPDDRARVEAGLHAAVAGEGETWSAEYRYLRADGSAAYVLDRGHLIRNAEGKAVRMIGGMTDLTSQREAAERLREQADLLDRANDAIMVRDFEHRILFWNAAAERIYGWRQEEALGHRADQLLGSDPALLREAMASVRTRGEWHGRISHRTRGGTPVTVEARWSLVKEEDGSPKAVLAIHSDITERLSLEEQLFQAQKLDSIGQLTGGIAHDFNNLLTVIIGNSELIARKAAEDPAISRLANMALSAGERGAELTRRLLAFARRQPLQPRAVDLPETLRGMEGLLRRAVGEAVELELRLEPGLWPLLIDPVQLEAAILNLGVNARDAMPGGGRLLLEAHNEPGRPGAAGGEAENGDRVRLTLSDTGTGMPPGILKRIFEPFFTTKDKGKGTGLGLSMVYGFIRQSGGEITVDSTLGEGTAFTLLLPRAGSRDLEGLPAPEPQGPSAGGGHERILLVEDDELVRTHSAGLLSELGYAVTAAASGPEALRIVEAGAAFDLLFTDVIMPGGMDGAELARRVLALRPGLPVLYTSGYTENSLLRDGQVDPGVDLLLKPYLKDSLAARIRDVLDRPRPPRAPRLEGIP